MDLRKRSMRRVARAGAGASGTALTIVVSVVAGVAVILTLALLLLPGYVRRRCVEAAAEQGIALELDGATLAPGVVHLRGLRFRIGAVPQLAGAAKEADVTLDGLSPRAAVLRAVTIILDGPVDEVTASIEAWRAARASDSSNEPESLSIQAGHLAWTRAFGESGAIDAGDLVATSDSRGARVRMVAQTTTLRAAPGGPVFGPWRLTFEREDAVSRARFDFDPAIRDGASALWVRTGNAGELAAVDAPFATSLKIAVPRTPLARIGVPGGALGLSADTQVEGSVDLERPTPAHATLAARLALYAARLGGAPVPVDVQVDLAAAGDPRNALDVSRGVMTVGPFRATLSGTVRLFPDGARAALAWKSAPVSCESLAAKLADPAALGHMDAPTAPATAARVVAAQLGVGAAAGVSALARGLGLPQARLTGDAHAAGLITLDTRNVGETTVSMTSSDTCGVGLFP